jgi:hypothetical protein
LENILTTTLRQPQCEKGKKQAPALALDSIRKPAEIIVGLWDDKNNKRKQAFSLHKLDSV